MRHLSAAVILVCFLGACAATQPEPPADEATATPGRYTDAEQAEILTESIELVFATDPQPEWFGAYQSLTVEDHWAYVTTTLSEADTALADSMCRDIAAATFDDEAEPIGITDVLIFGAGNADLTDCDVPEL